MIIDQPRTTAGHRLYPVEVRGICDVTPRMRRTVIGGGSLAAFDTDRPGQWVKLFIPVAGSPKAVGRAYTIRRLHRDRNEIEIDVVLHGHGPFASGAIHAAICSTFQLAGPQSAFQARDDADWLLFAGDETALAAIMAILEGRPGPPRIEAYVEIDGPGDE